MSSEGQLSIVCPIMGHTHQANVRFIIPKRSAERTTTFDPLHPIGWLAFGVIAGLTSVSYLERCSMAFPSVSVGPIPQHSRYAGHSLSLDSEKAAKFAKLRVRYMVKAKSKNNPILPARSA